MKFIDLINYFSKCPGCGNKMQMDICSFPKMNLIKATILYKNSELNQLNEMKISFQDYYVILEAQICLEKNIVLNSHNFSIWFRSRCEKCTSSIFSELIELKTGLIIENCKMNYQSILIDNFKIIIDRNKLKINDINYPFSLIDFSDRKKALSKIQTIINFS